MPAKKKAVGRHRTPYTPYTHTETVPGELVTKQSMKDECDINNIVAKYETTGVLTHLNASQATYADVSEIGGYRDALDKVNAVQEFFGNLPSELRAQFNNDPARYLDFIGTATEEDIKDLGSKRYGNKSGQMSPEKEVETTSETAESDDSG